MTNTSERRRVALDGCLNFRDLGGYPSRNGARVRMGQVFRSDALHLLSAADVTRLREELRIGDVIDLRSTGELRSEGRGRLADEAIRFHHIPFFDGNMRGRSPVEATSLADLYFLMTEVAREPIARVIRTLAHTDAPAVYHCAAGKDRTGVLSAIILGLLGVDDEVIVADYALTQETLEQIIERLMDTRGYQSMLAALPRDTMHANPETMITLLAHLRAKHGSVDGYAQAIGIPGGTIARLRDRLLA